MDHINSNTWSWGLSVHWTEKITSLLFVTSFHGHHIVISNTKQELGEK